jgi:hypothetical protein
MSCVPPLVYLYLWDPGEVDPPAVADLEKILPNLRNLSIVSHSVLTVPHRITTA